MFLQFLAPSARNLRKVGGPGQKAFWVFGENYDWNWSPDEEQPRPTTNFDTEPYGEWRLELEPGDSASSTASSPCSIPRPRRRSQMPPTHLVEGEHLTGAHIADSALNRVVAFSAAPDGAAPEGSLVYRFRPTARSFHLIANLTPQARYSLVARAARTREVTVRLIPDPQGTRVVGPQGVLSFELDAIVPGGTRGSDEAAPLARGRPGAPRRPLSSGIRQVTPVDASNRARLSSPLSMSSFVRPDLAGSQPLRDIAHDPKRSWRTWLVGRPLSTADAEHQTIGKTVGLAVFASDALSSTAYATQEILIILAVAGAAAFAYAFPIAVAIVVLLAIVTLSYEQTIHAYPGGGGAYIVARDNLGELPAQIAAAAAAHRLHPDRRRLRLLGRGPDRLRLPGLDRAPAWASR